MLARLPVQRQLEDTLYLAPGVSSGGGTGRPNPSDRRLERPRQPVRRRRRERHQPGLRRARVLLDHASARSAPASPFDFIKEVQVKTGGLRGASTASRPAAWSTSSPRAARNSSAARVFGYTPAERAPGRLQDQIETTNGTRPERSTPPRRKSATPASKSAGRSSANKPVLLRRHQPADGDARPSSRRSASRSRALGDVDARAANVVALLGEGAPGRPTGASRLDASFFGDPSTGRRRPAARPALLRTDTASFSELDKYGGHNQTLRYDGVMAPNLLIEGVVRARVQQASPRFRRSTLARSPTPRWCRTSAVGGIGVYEQGNDGQEPAVPGARHATSDRGGQHQVRYGVQYEDVEYDNISQPHRARRSRCRTAADRDRRVDRRSCPDLTLGRIFRVTRANYRTCAHDAAELRRASSCRTSGRSATA